MLELFFDLLGYPNPPSSQLTLILFSVSSSKLHHDVICLSTSAIQRHYDHHSPVNDVVIHPNQGELISCDQDGSVKVWDLAENNMSHELVRLFLYTNSHPFLSLPSSSKGDSV